MEVAVAFGGFAALTAGLHWMQKWRKPRVLPDDPECEIVVVQGQMNGDMARQFGRRLEACRAPRIALVLDSNGGWFSAVSEMIQQAEGYAGDIRVMIPYRAYSSATVLALAVHKSSKPLWISRIASISPMNPMAADHKTFDLCQSDIERTEQTIDGKYPPTAALLNLRLLGVQLRHTRNRIEGLLDRFCFPRLHVQPNYERKKVFRDLKHRLLLSEDIHHHMDFMGAKDLMQIGVQIEEVTNIPDWMHRVLQ